MVGERPVSLVDIAQKHGYVPNCTLEGLKPIFCNELENGTGVCDPYFQKVMLNRKWAIKEKVNPTLIQGTHSDIGNPP